MYKYMDKDEVVVLAQEASAQLNHKFYKEYDYVEKAFQFLNFFDYMPVDSNEYKYLWASVYKAIETTYIHNIKQKEAVELANKMWDKHPDLRTEYVYGVDF